MNDVLGLVLVAWIVYLWDAAWWVGPDSIVLTGRQASCMHVARGPRWVLRGDAGVFIPRLIPPFNYHLEVQPRMAAAGGADDAVIVAAAEAAFAAARPLLGLGAALWGFCFVAAPALMAAFGLKRVWIALAAVLFGAAILIVGVFARSWRRLYPHDRTGWRSHALPMILSPLAAICAADVLTRAACASFSGVAVAAALAPRDEFLRMARLYYFPVGGDDELKSVLAAKGLTASLFVPPDRRDPDMVGFCPRCHTQLSRSSGMCPDCGDVAVVAFEPELLTANC